jgi:hypothetical protein
MLRRSVLSATAFAAALIASAKRAAAAAQPIPTPSGKRLSTEDYVEIQQLYATYCHALDKGDSALFASVWTEDGEFTGGRGPGRADDARTPRKGAQALYQMGGTSGTRHFNANLVVSPTPEGAKGSVYLMLYTARTTPPTFVETAIYDDTLVKTVSGWKFKKRVVWRDDDDITPFKPKPLPTPAPKPQQQ